MVRAESDAIGRSAIHAVRFEITDSDLLVCVRETDRSLLMDYLDARLAGKKHKFPLSIRRFRQLRIIWERSTLHFDDELWPRKKHEPKGSRKIEITVKPSALIILQPAATVSV